MPIRRRISGGASLLDAMLYDDISIPLSVTLDVAHERSSKLSEAKADDRPSTGPN